MKKTVVSVKEILRVGPGPGLERWKVVEYTLDDFGPFVFEVKKNDFTWDAVKADMEKEEKALKSVTS